MQIQLLGYFIIPLGIMLFFLNENWLLYATIIFMGFTGSSIINIGTELSIQPSYFLGVLFILKHSVKILKRKKIVIPNKLLIFFIIICVCSMIMPLILQNKGIIVISQDNEYENVEFSSHNITQLMYVLFCFVFYWMTKDYLKLHPENKNKTIKMLIYGSVLVCILGLYQEMAYIYNLEFDKIFRSGIHGNVQPYGSFIRIYSTTIEPSMLSYYIAPIIVLLMCLNKDNIVNHKYCILFLSLIVGICTISTTFFLGIISFFIIIIVENLFKRKYNKKTIKKILIVSITTIIALTIVYFTNEDIIEALIGSTIGKITRTNDSGIERTSSFIQHLKIGLEYPILGVGFGTARSKDLFSTWICNIGVLGISVFLLYIVSIIKRLKECKTDLSNAISKYILIIFICAFVSVSEPYNLFIWYALALAENLIVDNEIKIERK